MHKDLVIYYMVGVFSTLTISAIAYGISRLRNYNPSSRLIYALIGLSVYMPIAQYLKLNSLHSYVDFSHWLQVLYSLSVSGKPLSLKEFYKAAIETKAERGAKGFTCWQQFVAMLFCQIGQAHSLLPVFADLTRGKVHEINIAWINKPFETLPFVPDAKQLSLRGI